MFLTRNLIYHSYVISVLNDEYRFNTAFEDGRKKCLCGTELRSTCIKETKGIDRYLISRNTISQSGPTSDIL